MVARVEEILGARGLSERLVWYETTARSAQESAATIGCMPEEIAKSLIFRGRESGRAYLVVLSGGRRIDEKLLREVVGEKVERPDAEFVKERTGFVIGSVAPIGARGDVMVLVDRSLNPFDRVYASGGDPYSVLVLAPDELLDLTGGRLVDVSH